VKAYILSLVVGVLVGVIYALFQVRSPAPPVIALVGLLGILIGEQLPSFIKQAWASDPPLASWVSDQVKPHAFGAMPTASSSSSEAPVGGASQTEQGKP
jgi:XapX domain-containing protein